MSTGSKWFGALVGVATISSFAVTSVASTAYARGAGKAKAATLAKARAAAANNACVGKKKVSPKGILKFSDWEFPDTMNPYQTTMATTAYVSNATQDGLWTYNSQAKFVPVMSQNIPSVKNGQIKNGGKLIIVKLKKGLRWSNGKEITSKDIVFGWKVGLDPATGPVCQGSCDVIARIKTPNKYEADMYLKSVYAPFLAYGTPPIWPSSWPGAWSNDPHAAAVKLAQDATFNFEGPNYPTTGAYQVTQFVKDDRIVMTPMKYYRTQSCGARLKQLIFAFYSDKAGMIAAAANHETDVTGGGGGYTVADLPALSANKGKFKLWAGAGFAVEHVEYNLDSQYNGKPNPLSNLKVRQAMNLTLDKIGLIRSALSVSKKQAQNIVGWTPFVNTPQLVQPFADKTIKGQYDPFTKKFVIPGTASAIKDAKKLLAQTPYSGGFSLDFVTTTGNPVRQAQANIMLNSWAKLNIKLNINYIPAGTLFADWNNNGTLQHGAFQVGMWGYLGSPDPDQWKYNFQSGFIDRRQSTHNQINANEAGIVNKKIDKAFNAAAKTLDPKVRAKNYKFVQQTFNKNAYWDILYFRPSIATSDKKVKNFSSNPTQVGPTWNVWNWTT